MLHFDYRLARKPRPIQSQDASCRRFRSAVAMAWQRKIDQIFRARFFRTRHSRNQRASISIQTRSQILREFASSAFHSRLSFSQFSRSHIPIECIFHQGS
jgi:hypothetical protein